MMAGSSNYTYAKRWRHERAQRITRIVDVSPATAKVAELLAAGWSVRAVADAADVSPSVVSHLGCGEQDRISGRSPSACVVCGRGRWTGRTRGASCRSSGRRAGCKR